MPSSTPNYNNKSTKLPPGKQNKPLVAMPLTRSPGVRSKPAAALQPRTSWTPKRPKRKLNDVNDGVNDNVNDNDDNVNDNDDNDNDNDNDNDDNDNDNDNGNDNRVNNGAFVCCFFSLKFPHRPRFSSYFGHLDALLL
jgi:hypothetical protein